MPNRHSQHLLRIIPFILISLSLACSLPFVTGNTPLPPTPTQGGGEIVTEAPPPPPTPTPNPLPPALVESDPGPNQGISLHAPITLYFNQAMDQASVESAFTGPPGQIKWVDEATLTYEPGSPLLPDSQLEIGFSTLAKATNGLALVKPVNLKFQTVGFLRLSQRLPEPETQNVNPTSAIVAAFNQPVVPLGANPESLPQAFTLMPASDGQAEWINTSTYIFYPKPALAGGRTYTVRINPDLTSAAGGPLENPASWAFTTLPARLLSVVPDSGSEGVHLDSDVNLTFNQPMDANSVEGYFTLLDPNSKALDGQFSWNQDATILTFNPRNLLKRNTVYTIVLDEQAQTSAGTSLLSGWRSSFRTAPPLRVLGSEPLQGGLGNVYAAVNIYFDAPIQSKDVLQFITFEPEVPNLRAYTDDDGRTLRLTASFEPSSAYTLIISPNLPDAWYGRLGKEFTLNFHTQPLDPNLIVSSGSDILFITPQESSLRVQATNLSDLSLSLGKLPMTDFMGMIAPGGYQLRQSYQPENQRTIARTLDLPTNRTQAVDIPLSLGSGSLTPGLYYLKFNLENGQIYPGPYLLVVSDLHLTFKLSATDALVWVVDLREGTPVIDAPIAIYAEDGTLLASGSTDSDGVFKASIPPQKDPYSTSFAVLGEPGEDDFALALSNWDQGLEGWNFGISTDYTPPRLETYLYTDRPIYRPGQTVYFRGVFRQAFNGRYSLVDQSNLTLSLYNDAGEKIESFDLPLSAFGTVHGSYTIPEGASLGLYRLSSEDTYLSTINFQVAEYRKPEINLNITPATDQILAGDPLTVTVAARYFFDAPAGNLAVKWSLYEAPADFQLPGYQVGLSDSSWLDPYARFSLGQFGDLVSEGQAQTDPGGLLNLEFATSTSDGSSHLGRQKYTLEVTAEDESGFPVSARASVLVNPADFYIGLQPDTWVGRADVEIGFEVQVVDWELNPAGERTLRANFQKVVWDRIDPKPGDVKPFPTYIPHYTPIGSADFTTGPDGVARLAFTPPDPGTYQLAVYGFEQTERGAESQILLWVAGPGEAVWPNLPNQRLRLTADRLVYKPGDTAQVFIPNPLGQGALALVTVERGVVFHHEVLRLDEQGLNYSLPLDDQDAPNVYLAVTLLKGYAGEGPDFRQGYLNLAVEPVAQTLRVSLTSDPQRSSPGGTINFDTRLSDAQGNPVSGEFSLSVVDLAVLTLADTNSEEILPAFYGNQPLGVRTGLDLAVYSQRRAIAPEGIGGGGGGELLPPPVIRQTFPDTAFWNADILTDENGEAQVTMTLPDNLTTWQVDLRGLTTDTQVGQAEAQIVSTKDLLIRPVTPRFLVVGDHALLAAVVQNNTDSDLQGKVSLQASGFDLDDPNTASQPVSLSAGGRHRLEWWGISQDVPSIDLVFTVQAGELEDAARPTGGALPVLRFTAPQTFGTAGTIDQAGERLELLSLPRSFDPQSGQLTLELAPSLAAAMTTALEALENYPYACTEQVLSRFLPNLETLRMLQDFSLEAPALQIRLDQTLDESLTQLLSRQNEDGGWGWWQNQQSDAYFTAYVLFGLSRTHDAGITFDRAAIQKAISFLQAGLPAPQMLSQAWQFDRLAFEHYALAVAGAGDLGSAAALYESRLELNPWAQALLALTIENLSPGDERAQTLLSDLETKAIRSATGSHWEDREPDWRNMSTPVFTTAVVLYTLAQQNPASPLVADSLRYLMAQRRPSGGWTSTYDNAWALMALAQVMKGTGELGGDFNFEARLNDDPLANGQATVETQLTPINAQVPISQLYPHAPNALIIQRDSGPGKLYYTARLSVDRPVEGVVPLDQGISLSRDYYPAADECPQQNCTPIHLVKAGEMVNVRLTLTVPETAYYLLVEDYIPAGSEILDVSLKTSQQGSAPSFDPQLPFLDGWGWWYFSTPQIFDDHIAWAASSLPPGTYQLTYTLVALQAGEFRVLPARAWQFYFPEVQGNSAGELFEIKP